MFAPYHKLTLQQKQQIVEVFNNGMECRDISKYIKVSSRSVAILRETSINTKRKNRYTLNEAYFDVIDSTKKSLLTRFNGCGWLCY